MADINGSFITEIDGTKFYTDGIIHSNISISANVAFIQFGGQKNTIDGSWSDQYGLTSFDGPIVMSIDQDGNLQTGVSAGLFNVGVVRYNVSDKLGPLRLYSSTA